MSTRSCSVVALTAALIGDLVGLLGALALHLELGARLVDGAVGPGEVGLRDRERAADVLGLLVRLGDRGGALLDLLREVLRLLARLEELLVRLEHALLAALRLTARGLEVLAHRVEVDAGGLELGGGSTCRRLRLQDAVGELRLRLLHLAPVGGLHVGELALERLARVAHLLLEIGLALHEVGAVGGLAALELGLRGTELVLEHRRSLLLVAQGAQLRPRVVELAARAIGDRAGRGEVVLGAQQLDVHRVELAVQLGVVGGYVGPLGADDRLAKLGLGELELVAQLRGLGLERGDAQVGVVGRSRPVGVRDRLAKLDASELELGAQLRRLGFERRDTTGVGVDRHAQRVAELLAELAALGVERVDALLERADLTLGAERPLLQLGVDRRARLTRELAVVLQLLERLAVLVLQQARGAPRRRSRDPRPCGARRPPRGGPAAATAAPRAARARRSRGAGRARPGCAATICRSRATPKTASPSTNSIANKKIAFVFHGLSALAIGASERVSSTAAGAPTPERNWNGSMIETVPWYRPTCGVSLSASLIWSFSPGSSLPIWPVSVEYRTVPSGEYIVTLIEVARVGHDGLDLRRELGRAGAADRSGEIARGEQQRQ